MEFEGSQPSNMAKAATSPTGAGSLNSNSEIMVTFEDQSKINRFSCLNARLEELKEEVKLRQKQLEHTDEALNEIILADDSDPDAVHVQVGEVFAVMDDRDLANEWLEEKKTELNNMLQQINQQMDEIKEEMSSLKVQLYGKFGNNINLESDDQ